MPNVESIRREVENEFSGWKLSGSIIDSLTAERFSAKLAREIERDAILADLEEDCLNDYVNDYEREEK